MVMAAINIHPVQPIVEAVETVGENPWSKTRTKRPGAKNYNRKYTRNAHPKGSIYRKHKEKPNSEKNQKSPNP